MGFLQSKWCQSSKTEKKLQGLLRLCLEVAITLPYNVLLLKASDKVSQDLQGRGVDCTLFFFFFSFFLFLGCPRGYLWFPGHGT